MYFCACGLLQVTGSKGFQTSVRYSYTRRRSTAACHSVDPSGQTRFAMATPSISVITVSPFSRLKAQSHPMP